MIFVTVGTQLAFDRMVRAVDAWAGERGRSDLFAQIGPEAYVPQHFASRAFMDPGEFAARARDATAIVAHAGMGSILTALEFGKPILIMPRIASLGEQRNDHQVATARRFLEMGRVSVAFDEEELKTKLDTLDSMRGAQAISPWASPELIAGIKAFINGDRAIPPGR